MSAAGRCVLANQVCPQTSDPAARRYCPAWWETILTRETTNGTETTVQKGCGWGQLPLFLSQALKVGAEAAATAQEGRNEVAGLTQGFRAVALTLHEASNAHPRRLHDHRAGPGAPAIGDSGPGDVHPDLQGG